MKKILALGVGCLLSQGTMAQDATAPVANILPVLPSDCSEQMTENERIYCSSNEIDGNQVTVTFAAKVSKEVFPTVDSILSRYQNVARWPEYAAASPQKVIEFKKGGSVDLDEKAEVKPAVLRHSYSYNIKVQGIPLLKQEVIGLTHNTVLATPYVGARGSLEYKAITNGSDPDYQVKTKGVKSQTGSIHAVDCSPVAAVTGDAEVDALAAKEVADYIASIPADISALCEEGKMVLVYTTVAQPDISLAMTIAGNTITAGIEDLLVGMLDESIVDPVATPAE